MGKNNEYLEISKQIVANIGGMDNIQGTAHCATRLRIVLKDNDLADIEKLEDIDKVKGAFIAGNQLQLILGAGTVNDVYEVFAEYTNTQNMSLGDLKEESVKRQNPLQAVIKALSDVFIGIMPALLAAALLMGITSVLGGLEVVKTHDTLYAINRLVSLASTGIFAILPMAVCYSAVKRFGGNPVLGMVIGAIMLDSSLANAYQAAQGTVDIEVIRLFGLKIEMVGFQGGIIIALMMGFVVAKLDKFFNKVIPDVIKLLVAPMLTVFISTVLLFTLVGPAGRILSNGITDGLMWSTEHLGAFGYALFAGVQQIVVITGLHHIIGAVEAQLIASTGTNFLNPLMSVALFGQSGAVLGYLSLNWKNLKARELCIPSFCSTLFGISEPAIFGVNLRYKFPLIGGCIGGAVAGAYVYYSKLTALGFGTTALPGMAIANPAHHGYINYIIAHAIAITITMDVSDKPGYNNMAIGMYAGNSGNTLYCPTGYLELLRLQDRFVYLPEMPYRKVDLDKAKRNVLTQEEFTEAGGKGNVAGWLNTITVENVHPNTTVAIRMKGIAGKADTFTLYAYDKENKLKEVPAELWHIQEEDGTLPDKLTEDTLYEVHVMVEDGGEFDLSDTEKEIKIAVILGNK